MTVTVSYTRSIIQPAFRANLFTTDNQTDPALLGLASGAHVLGYNNSSGEIALDWYDAAFGPSGSTRFPAQGPTEAIGEASLTRLQNGNVLVAWQEHQVDDRGIRARLFTADGAPLGNELALLDVIPPDAPALPEIAALPGGGFALAYTMGNDGVFAALFDDSGVGSVLPGPMPTGIQSGPAIAVLADGGFIVTYTQSSGGSQLFGRLYNADGSLRRADFVIDADASNPNSEVAALPNGNFALVWNDATGGHGPSLRIFNPAGDAVSDLLHVAAANSADPELTVLPNGLIVMSWTFPDAPFEQSVYGRLVGQDGKALAIAGSGTDPFRLSAAGGSEGNAMLAAIGAAGRFVASWTDSASDGSGTRVTSEVSQLVRHQSSDDASDTILGDALDDVMLGNGGNDSFTAGGGSNAIDGGAGTDTAVYSLALSAYQVWQHGAQLTVSGPSNRDTLDGIEWLQLADGTLAADDGNGLFDTFFYMARNPDVFHAGVDAIAHYNSFGWREGRDPNAWFDSSGYLAVNRDVAAAGVNPLEHYHQVGWKEGRDPSALFDTRRYLIDNPDVAAAGIDPLEHYIVFGFAEGRTIHRAVGPVQQGFDAQYYLLHNPDVAAAGVDALAHFDLFGRHEGRDPNFWFDTTAYLAANPDVAASGANPLQHYMTFGWKEGRDASERFHTADYLAANPDIAAAGVNPLEHFLQFGFYENRAGVDYGLWMS